MKWFKRVTVSSVILLAMLLVFTLFYLLYTPQGLRFSIQIANYFIPGTLQIDQAQGRLGDQFELRGFQYNAPTTQLHIQHVKLTWQPFKLLYGRLHIQSLHLQTFKLNTSKPQNVKVQNKATSSFWQQLKTYSHLRFTPPIALHIDQFTAYNSQYNAHTLQQIKLRDFALNTNQFTGTLQAQYKAYNLQTQVTGQPLHFNLTGTVQSGKRQLMFHIARAGQLWSVQSLRGHMLQGHIVARGHIDLTPNIPKWSLQLQARGLNLQPIWPGHHSKIDIQVQSHGDQDQWYGQLQRLHGSLDGFPIKGQATLALDQRRLTKLKLNLRSEQARININGKQWPNWDTNWRLVIPELSYFNSAWSGSIRSKGQITGPHYKPDFKGAIHIADLLVNQYLLGHHDIKLQGHVAKHKRYRLSIHNKGRLPELGLRLHPMNFKLQGQGSNFSVQGRIYTNDHPLHLHMQSKLLQKGSWQVQGKVKGAQVLISNTPQYRIYASPDLSFQYQPNTLNIKGDLLFPQARIRYKHDLGVVEMPDDVVYIDQRSQKPKQTQSAEPPLLTDLDIRLGLGDNIHLSMMGVKGKATGKVHLTQKPGENTQAKGMIQLQDAAYKAYGQNLAIQPGRFIFQNDPITNPHLNIRASREVHIPPHQVDRIYAAQIPAKAITKSRYVKVGVAITGTAESPKIKLYSQPAGYNDADILSLLLTGYPASQLQQQGKTALLMETVQLLRNRTPSAITSLPSQLVDTLRITQVSDAQAQEVPGQDETALVVGKYLLPDLYVSYSMGLTSNVSELTVRYDLGDNWEIQTETSPVDTGIDIYYTLESSK